MKFSAPTAVTFLLSLIIAGLGMLAAAGTLSFIPLAPVWVVSIGYGILAVGNLFKGA